MLPPALDTIPPPPADPVPLYRAHLRASGASPRTIRLRADHAAQILALGPLEEIARSDLEAWIQPPGRRYAAETLKSRRSSARRFCAWLHDEEWIERDPAARLHPISIPASPPRVIPDRDMRRALARANARDRAALLLARYACLRLSELSSLRMQDRQSDHLRIRGKGGRVRIVYLHPELQAALNALEDELPRGFYFPGAGENAHMHPQSMHKILKRVSGWNPHALRHAGASAAYRATKDLRAVQLMLGHSSLATTQRYLSLDEDALRAVAAGVEVVIAA